MLKKMQQLSLIGSTCSWLKSDIDLFRHVRFSIIAKTRIADSSKSYVICNRVLLGCVDLFILLLVWARLSINSFEEQVTVPTHAPQRMQLTRRKVKRWNLIEKYERLRSESTAMIVSISLESWARMD